MGGQRPIGGLIDRETGELADAETIAAAALDYVLLEDEVRHDRADLADKEKRLSKLAGDLIAILPPGAVLEAGPAALVSEPAPRPAQRVSRSGCEAYSEELLALGIGHVAYQPPGIAEVRRNAARILAAGIDLERIAPTPMPGPARLKVVPR